MSAIATSPSRTQAGVSTLQPEDYQLILKRICLGNWGALAVALMTEVLIMLSSDYDWPRWGNFTWTYNSLLLEFGFGNLVLTILLARSGWLERAPRDAIRHLRQLLLATLVWGGFHILAFFQVTGSLHGPIIVLLPILVITAYLMLPLHDANISCGSFVCAFLLLLAAQAYGLVEERGMLADAFDLNSGHYLPFVVVCLACLAAAMLVGLAARTKMDTVGISLHRASMIDPYTQLFTRELLERRIPGELQRLDRDTPTAALLLFEVNDFDDVNTQCGYRAGGELIRDMAAGLIGVTSPQLDTCALYAPTTFAALLPTASADEALKIAEKIRQFAANVRLQGSQRRGAHVAIGIAATAQADKTDARALMDAADLALQDALQNPGDQLVVREIA